MFSEEIYSPNSSIMYGLKPSLYPAERVILEARLRNQIGDLDSQQRAELSQRIGTEFASTLTNINNILETSSDAGSEVKEIITDLNTPILSRMLIQISRERIQWLNTEAQSLERSALQKKQEFILNPFIPGRELTEDSKVDLAILNIDSMSPETSNNKSKAAAQDSLLFLADLSLNPNVHEAVRSQASTILGRHSTNTMHKQIPTTELLPNVA